VSEGVLEVGDTFTGYIGTGDKDGFLVWLTKNVRYRVTVRGSWSLGFIGNLPDPKLVVKASDGTVIIPPPDQGTGTDELWVGTAAVDGAYLFQVSSGDLVVPGSYRTEIARVGAVGEDGDQDLMPGHDNLKDCDTNLEQPSRPHCGQFPSGSPSRATGPTGLPRAAWERRATVDGC